MIEQPYTNPPKHLFCSWITSRSAVQRPNPRRPRHALTCSRVRIRPTMKAARLRTVLKSICRTSSITSSASAGAAPAPPPWPPNVCVPGLWSGGRGLKPRCVSCNSSENKRDIIGGVNCWLACKSEIPYFFVSTICVCSILKNVLLTTRNKHRAHFFSRSLTPGGYYYRSLAFFLGRNFCSLTQSSSKPNGRCFRLRGSGAAMTRTGPRGRSRIGRECPK